MKKILFVFCVALSILLIASCSGGGKEVKGPLVANDYSYLETAEGRLQSFVVFMNGGKVSKYASLEASKLDMGVLVEGNVVSITTNDDVDIIVNTNGKDLAVTAPNATLSQYGKGGNVVITSIKGDSYHGYSKLESLTVGSGRVELNASVENLLVAAVGEVKVELSKEATVSTAVVGGDSKISLKTSGTLGSVALLSPVEVEVSAGKVGSIDAQVEGVVISGKGSVEKIQPSAPIEINVASVASIVVPETVKDVVVISLGENTAVKTVEAQGETGIVGGSISVIEAVAPVQVKDAKVEKVEASASVSVENVAIAVYEAKKDEAALVATGDTVVNTITAADTVNTVVVDASSDVEIKGSDTEASIETSNGTKIEDIHTHSFELIDTVPSTTTVQGKKVYKCSCGVEKTEILPLLSSDPEEKVTVDTAIKAVLAASPSSSAITSTQKKALEDVSNNLMEKDVPALVGELEASELVKFMKNFEINLDGFENDIVVDGRLNLKIVGDLHVHNAIGEAIVAKDFTYYIGEEGPAFEYTDALGQKVSTNLNEKFFEVFEAAIEQGLAIEASAEEGATWTFENGFTVAFDGFASLAMDEVESSEDAVYFNFVVDDLAIHANGPLVGSTDTVSLEMNCDVSIALEMGSDYMNVGIAVDSLELTGSALLNREKVQLACTIENLGFYYLQSDFNSEYEEYDSVDVIFGFDSASIELSSSLDDISLGVELNGLYFKAGEQDAGLESAIVTASTSLAETSITLSVDNIHIFSEPKHEVAFTVDTIRADVKTLHGRATAAAIVKDLCSDFVNETEDEDAMVPAIGETGYIAAAVVYDDFSLAVKCDPFNFRTGVQPEEIAVLINNKGVSTLSCVEYIETLIEGFFPAE